MGKLIIEGNSVYEIDEYCIKTHKMPKDCNLPTEIWNIENNKINDLENKEHN